MEFKINIGDEYKIKIERESEFGESIFSDVYKNAASIVEEIINQSKETGNNEHIHKLSKDNYNNVIAFTGERGTGKSSAMISFAEAIIQKTDSNVQSLDVIDPSLFKGDDKLFEIIISKMFSKFQEKLKKKEDEINHDTKRNLIEQFQKVYNNLKVLNGGKNNIYDKEAIEALSDLAYGTNLKESFYKLVNLYLSYVGDKSSKFLLIPIDDFDLNISGAYEMLEDIRQFLIQQNIILLIACKIDQLQDSLDLEIVKEYEKLIKNKEFLQKTDWSLEIANKSIRYLDKLIPIERRLTTPIFNKVFLSDKQLTIVDKKLIDNEIYSEGLSIDKSIIKLIYNKSSHIITWNDFEDNIIIPKTLRELANTITFLYRENGLSSFKKYLLKSIEDDLSQNEIIFFNDLENTSNKTLNQFIVNWLGENEPNIITESRLYNERRREYEMRREYELRRELDMRKEYEAKRNTNNRGRDFQESELINITSATKYYNVSFGDILFLLKELESKRVITNKPKHNLYTYIKIYYSLRISEAVSNKSPLNDFINLNLTNTYQKYFPAEKSGYDRHEFIIKHSPKSLQELISGNEILNDLLKDSDINGFDDLYLWLSSFFTLIGNQINQYRQDEDNQSKRTIEKVGSPYNSVTFNSLSFLYNVLSPDNTIERFFNDKTTVKESKLYKNIIDWKTGLCENDDYYNIFNLQLFDEFITEIHKFSISKDSFNTFGDRMYTYIVKGIEKVTDLLIEKYPHIELKIINTNPIIKYWTNNREVIDELLSQIFELSYIDNFKSLTDSEIARDLLKTHRKRYLNGNPGLNIRPKSTMNNIVKAFKYKPEIHKELKEYYSIIENSKSQEETISGVNLIYEFLTKLANG